MNMKILLIALVSSSFMAFVNASCKATETDPYAPHAGETTAQRLYSFVPKAPADLTAYATDTLTVMTYNIQSGFSLSCVQNTDAQAALFKGAHYIDAQEVDIGIDSHCNCNQPQKIADGTGHSTWFLRTIFYRTGLYGSLAGTVYPVDDVQIYMYNAWSTERRGILAIHSFPPQLKGRGLWFVETHLQYDDATVRANQARELVAFVTNLTTYYPNNLYIVPGDYYTTPGDEGYIVLTQYFQNAWLVAHGLTDCDTYPSNSPTNFFDHVWYKVPSDLTVQIADAHHINTQDSDHVPVVVSFAFPGLNVPPADPIQTQLVGGTGPYWVGLYIKGGGNNTAKAELHDSSSGVFYPMALQSWGAFMYSSSAPLTLPLSLRLTSSSGKIVVLNNFITSFSQSTYTSSASYSSGTGTSTMAPTNSPTGAPTGAPTTTPGTNGITFTAHPSVNSYWYALKIDNNKATVAQVFLESSGGAFEAMSTTDYGYWILSPSAMLVAPLSVKLVSSSGTTLTFLNVIKSITPSSVYTTASNF